MREIKLAQTIKDLMERKGVSARKVAQDCKIPQSSLASLFSSNSQKMDARYLDEIASYFDVSLEYLFFGSEKKIKKVQSMKTEKIFNGYLKVNIERVIPDED